VIAAKLTSKVKVKRSRLSLDVFMQIYRATANDWLRNAMALALITGQRRQDIAVVKFKDFRTELVGGQPVEGWWLTQQSGKTQHEHKIVVGMTVRLNVLGLSLADVVSQCRRTGVASQFLIHRNVYSAHSKVGARLSLANITNAFQDEMDKLAIDWGDKTPPTFHEIRSLSERLHAVQGGINTQHLLGHDNAATTATYHDPRGDEWRLVRSITDLFPKHKAIDS
jgi:integrase